MISFVFLVVSVAILVAQLFLDDDIEILDPIILFQIYFIIQLPLNLFLGTNYTIPRFDSLSVHTPSWEVAELGSIILFAQVMIVAAYSSTKFPKLGFKSAPVKWKRKRVTVMSIGFMLVGYAAFIALIQANGGYSTFLQNREAWRSEGITGQGWLLLPATTLLSVAACAILLGNISFFRKKRGHIALVLLAIIVTFPPFFLGFRGFIILPVFQFLYFYNFYIKKISMKYSAFFGVLLILVFTLFGIERSLPYDSSKGSYPEYLLSVYYNQPELIFSVFLRSMGADILRTTVDYMAVFGSFKYFLSSMVETITIFIPQSLWPDKPTPLSVQYSRELFNLNGGVSATIVGDGYWRWGIFGVTMLSIFVGVLFRYFAQLKKMAGVNVWVALLMLSIYPSLFMMAEAFQGYMNGIVLIVLLNLILRVALSFDLANNKT